MEKNIEDRILEDRGKTYGPFENIAKTTELLHESISLAAYWHKLTSKEREAIKMALHKIAGIANSPYTGYRKPGNAKDHYNDSWIDAVGYLKLGNPEAFEDE